LFFQIMLVILFGAREFAFRKDLHKREPLVVFRLRLAFHHGCGNPLLFGTAEENHQATRRPDVGNFTVWEFAVVNRQEVFDQLPVGNSFRIECNAARFNVIGAVRAHGLTRGSLARAARVAYQGIGDAFELSKRRLQMPETSAAKRGGFRSRYVRLCGLIYVTQRPCEADTRSCCYHECGDCYGDESAMHTYLVRCCIGDSDAVSSQSESQKVQSRLLAEWSLSLTSLQIPPTRVKTFAASHITAGPPQNRSERRATPDPIVPSLVSAGVMFIQLHV